MTKMQTSTQKPDGLIVATGIAELTGAVQAGCKGLIGLFPALIRGRLPEPMGCGGGSRKASQPKTGRGREENRTAEAASRPPGTEKPRGRREKQDNISAGHEEKDPHRTTESSHTQEEEL
jgi:hypothetical protein